MQPLPLRHSLAALAVIVIWGTNFVVIHRGLDEFPPLLFATMRFAFAALPFVFFITPPKLARWRTIAYGLLIGIGQFGLLFIAMDGHVSPGLASALIQLQALFTVLLAAVVYSEALSYRTWLGLSLATAGLLLVASSGSLDVDGLGLLLCLAAAASWAGGNILAKGCPKGEALALVVWSSLAAVPVLAVLSVSVDGPEKLLSSLSEASAPVWLAAAWQGIGNSLIGYGIWNWLLANHPASRIAPLSLLVPVVGLAAAAVFIDEPMQGWKISAAALIGLGVGVNVFSRSTRSRSS